LQKRTKRNYSLDNEYTESYLNETLKKINALRYIKLENSDQLNLYKNIDIMELEKAHCNDDRFKLIYLSGEIETFFYSQDKRAKAEFEAIKKRGNKIPKKVINN